MMNVEQHNRHMDMVKQGLERIVVSEDIAEIKQIAQELLSYEESEEQGGMEDNALRNKLSGAIPEEEGGMSYG